MGLLVHREVVARAAVQVAEARHDGRQIYAMRAHPSSGPGRPRARCWRLELPRDAGIVVASRSTELMMPTEVKGIHSIANTDTVSRAADVVFIHGLGGDPFRTWTNGERGSSDYFFWPEELGKHRPDLGVWTVGYPAGITAMGTPGMSIQKRAENVALTLVNAGLGDRSLIFVAHSMGGLIAKSLVVLSSRAESATRALAPAVKGMVFCATPHLGADYASLARTLSKALGGAQKHVRQMQKDSEYLNDLHNNFISWRSRHNRFLVESYIENIPLMHKRWWWRPLPLGLVVNQASGDPKIEGAAVYSVDEDHSTITKPRSRDHDVYGGVIKFIDRALAAAAAAAPADHGRQLRKLAGKVIANIKFTQEEAMFLMNEVDPVVREEFWRLDRQRQDDNEFICAVARLVKNAKLED